MSEQVDFKFINSEFEKLKDVIKSKGSIIEPITRNNTKTVDYITAEISSFNRRGYNFRTFLETPLFTLVEHIDCFIPTTELEHSVDLRQFLISTMTNFYNRNNVIGYESKLISFIDRFIEHFNTRDHAKEWTINNQKGWISANTPPEIPDMYLVCVSNTICFQHEKEVVKVMSYNSMTGWGGIDCFANVVYWRPIPDLPDEVMEYFK